MNPFLNEIIGAVIRTGVAFVLGWLVNQMIISADQATEWTTAITGGALVLLWSIWQKYRSRKKLVTALASPAGSSEHRVEAMVSAGNAPPVTVPKNVPPYLPKPPTP